MIGIRSFSKQLQAIAAIEAPSERFVRYTGEVVKRLDLPNGGLSWRVDRRNIKQAIELLRGMGDDVGLAPGSRADALEAIRDLSNGSNSPLGLATRYVDSETMVKQTRKVAERARTWETTRSLEPRILALRQDQVGIDQARSEVETLLSQAGKRSKGSRGR